MSYQRDYLLLILDREEKMSKLITVGGPRPDIFHSPAVV